MRARDDDGSILPLIAFAMGLAFALILLAVAATSLYLERKRLLTLADGAALVGAEAFELEDVEPTGEGLTVALDDSSVATAVEDYLAALPAGDFDGLRLERAASLDGRSATVVLSAQWHPPVVSIAVPDGIRIEVTATARSVFG